jgi:uncharacterized protein
VPAYLLDVNLLIALAWPEHSLHDKSRRWFARYPGGGWATCPIVEAGFIRLLSNPSFSSRALTVDDAIKVLERNLELPGHQFWPDSISLPEAVEMVQQTIKGHKQITDAYLVALALKHKGKLATLDRGILKFAPAKAVEVIE